MIPYWLQIAAVVTGLATGVAGTILGIINLYLRWSDRKPNLEVVYHRILPLGSQGMTIVNKSQRDATVTKFCIKVESEKGKELLDLSNRLFNSEALPMRIAAEDSAQVVPIIGLVYELLKSRGHYGRIKVMPVVEDGIGNLHRAKAPFFIGRRKEKASKRPSDS